MIFRSRAPEMGRFSIYGLGPGTRSKLDLGPALEQTERVNELG